MDHFADRAMTDKLGTCREGPRIISPRKDAELALVFIKYSSTGSVLKMHPGAGQLYCAGF